MLLRCTKEVWERQQREGRAEASAVFFENSLAAMQKEGSGGMVWKELVCKL